MQGRGDKTYYRNDNGRAITDEDIYHMIMLRNYQQWSITRIAKRFSIQPVEARILIGRRACGSCCG